ncbi:hypothetical protein HKX48_002511 [Thoreauomyces humboldtii]|nr:hypothetical protein HKX48_002511 [Thoreauomyces humboldtii]
MTKGSAYFQVKDLEGGVSDLELQNGEFSGTTSIDAPPAYSDADLEHGDLVHGHEHGEGCASDVDLHAGRPPLFGDSINARLFGWYRQRKTFICSDPRLQHDPKFLHDYLLHKSRQRPSMTVRITGTHTERRKSGDKSTTTTVTDFDVRVDVAHHLRRKLPEWDDGRDCDCKRPDLMELCEKYCADKRKVKSISYRNTVGEVDVETIKNLLIETIRNTRYNGSISVTFPVERDRWSVRSDHWMNRARTNVPILVFFVITFLWIFAWPILWIVESRHRVPSTPYHFDNVYDPEGADTAEVAFLRTYTPAIRRAVLAKRDGWITRGDFEEIDTFADGNLPTDQPISTGNATADTALNFLRAAGNLDVQIRGWGGNVG